MRLSIALDVAFRLIPQSGMSTPIRGDASGATIFSSLEYIMPSKKKSNSFRKLPLEKPIKKKTDPEGVMSRRHPLDFGGAKQAQLMPRKKNIFTYV